MNDAERSEPKSEQERLREQVGLERWNIERLKVSDDFRDQVAGELILMRADEEELRNREERGEKVDRIERLKLSVRRAYILFEARKRAGFSELEIGQHLSRGVGLVQLEERLKTLEFEGRRVEPRIIGGEE